jgi:hypothetical protein
MKYSVRIYKGRPEDCTLVNETILHYPPQTIFVDQYFVEIREVNESYEAVFDAL